VKRVLCGLLVAGTAFVAVPAHATDPGTVGVQPWNDANRTGVGTTLFGQPGAAAYRNNQTGQVCVGFSYQIPQCTEPIEVVAP
jgi:hypothetical protein